MSAFGTKQTSESSRAMSAFERKTDIKADIDLQITLNQWRFMSQTG